MLIAGCELEGAIRDVRVSGDRVAAIAPHLEPVAGEPRIEAAGGALLPGLHDHHLHLLALAAALDSVDCGPPAVADPAALAAALRAARPRDGWVRGVGYHASVAGELDRAALDAIDARRPLRVQHRGGALWVLNSPALARVGAKSARVAGIERDASGQVTGRLYRCDGWLRERLGVREPPRLAPVGQRLARLGVTGATDATPDNDATSIGLLGAAIERGELSLRLCLMGEAVPEHGLPARAERGEVKLVVDERAPPAPDALAGAVGRAHEGGRAVAIHCVTRTELVLALAALRAAGPRAGDRLEHASVAPPELVAQAAELGLTVVTQPGLVALRGDSYLAEVEAADRPWLYRCRAWLDAGVALGGGTDAPFGDPDPWLAMRAAVERRTRRGAALGAAEALAPERALALFTTPARAPGAAPRRVRAGAPADLCLLDRGWSRARERLRADDVRATWSAGELVWRADARGLRSAPDP